MSRPADLKRARRTLPILVVMALLLTACARGPEDVQALPDAPLPTTEPTSMDCRQPVPIPLERRSDCVRAGLMAMEAVLPTLERSAAGYDCCGIRYLEDEHAMLLTFYPHDWRISEHDKHLFQTAVQEALGLRAHVEIVDDWRNVPVRV